MLVEEDESLVRKLAARILQSRGHRVIAAESPKDAQRLAHGGDQAIDLVLTDVRLVDKPFTAETLLRSVRKTLEGDLG